MSVGHNSAEQDKDEATSKQKGDSHILVALAFLTPFLVLLIIVLEKMMA